MSNSVESQLFDALSELKHDATTPVYMRIYQTLKKMILSGELADGSKFPSDKDLVVGMPFSHITLAKALNELRKQGLLERGRAKGTYVKTPIRRANSHHSAFDRQVAVIFDDVNPQIFQSELFISLNHQLQANNLGMFFITSGGSPEMQFEQVKSVFSSTQCVGCLVWSILAADSISSLMSVKPIDFPIVFMGDGTAGCDCSLFDEIGAGKTLAQLALRKGYDKSVIVVPERLKSSAAPLRSPKRIEAFREYFKARNVPSCNVDLMYYSHYSELNLDAICEMVDEGALIICLSPSTASVIKRHFDSIGESAGLPLVSFGPSGFGVLVDEDISEMHYDMLELSENAMDILTSRLNGDRREWRHLFAKAKLIERGTFEAKV